MEIISPVAYHLALPPTLKIHPVFHVSLLKPYMSPEAVPDREAKQLPPPAVLVDEHEEFEVEQVLARRSHRRRIEYLVKWVGYPEYDTSWEPESNLDNAKDAIAEFEREQVGNSNSVIEDDNKFF